MNNENAYESCCTLLFCTQLLIDVPLLCLLVLFCELALGFEIIGQNLRALLVANATLDVEVVV